MKSVLFMAVLATSLPALADQQRLIPAGALIQCTTADPKLNSRTAAIGDPVLCVVNHASRYGGADLPYHSSIVGRFEDYKDPGHFVGKGWMELKFDHAILSDNSIVPLDAKVVDVPGFRIDRDGKILGKGHATRDVLLWSVPILWPLDLLMLPARGPRPSLRSETRITLKIMDDVAFSIPDQPQPRTDAYGLSHRSDARPAAPLPPPPADEPAQPTEQADAAPYPVQEEYAQPVCPAQCVAVPYGVPEPVVVYAQMAPPPVVLPGAGYSYAYAYRPAATSTYTSYYGRPLPRLYPPAYGPTGRYAAPYGRTAYPSIYGRPSAPPAYGRPAAPSSYGRAGYSTRAYAAAPARRATAGGRR